MAVMLLGGGFGAGWRWAQLHYRERIEILKERLEAAQPKNALGPEPTPAIVAAFDYPGAGRHGRNVLAPEVESLRVGEALSMRAVIPSGSQLKVTLTGPKPSNLSDASSAWGYSMGTINWTGQAYIEEGNGEPPRQSFIAEQGIADLALHLHRPGIVEVDVFEDQARTASWRKTIRVLS